MFDRLAFLCVPGRGWFTSQSSTVTSSDLSTSSNTSVDMGAGEGGGAVERWGVFGPRLVVQKSITDTGADHTSTGKWDLGRVIFNMFSFGNGVPLNQGSFNFSCDPNLPPTTQIKKK